MEIRHRTSRPPRRLAKSAFTSGPATTGSFCSHEILRVIDSLQLTDAYSVSTPVNWEAGEDVIIVPSVSDTEPQRRFPLGWRAVKPYLRLTPDPRSPIPPDIDIDATG